MKIWRLAGMLALALSLAATAGFEETFARGELNEEWSCNYRVKCAGVALAPPVPGRMQILGLEQAQPGAVAYLDRGSENVNGDFQLLAELEFEPAAGAAAGAYRLQLLTGNGEKLIEAALERNSRDGAVQVTGHPGHSGQTVSRSALSLAAAPTAGNLEITRKQGHYFVRFQDVVVYTDEGDTAPAASFRLVVSGAAGKLTVKRLRLAALE